MWGAMTIRTTVILVICALLLALSALLRRRTQRALRKDPALAVYLGEVERAARLRRANPAEADRIEARAEAAYEAACQSDPVLRAEAAAHSQSAARELAELRAAAVTSKKAALKLRRVLRDSLKGADYERAALQRDVTLIPDLPAALRSIDDQERALRDELSALEAAIQRMGR